MFVIQSNMGVICHLALSYWCMEWYPHRSSTHLHKWDSSVFCIPKQGSCLPWASVCAWLCGLMALFSEAGLRGSCFGELPALQLWWERLWCKHFFKAPDSQHSFHAGRTHFFHS